MAKKAGIFRKILAFSFLILLGAAIGAVIGKAVKSGSLDGLYLPENAGWFLFFAIFPLYILAIAIHELWLKI
jgi:hypothetical protein